MNLEPSEPERSSATEPAEPLDDDAVELGSLVRARPRHRWLRWTLISVGIVGVVGWALVAGQRLDDDPTQIDSPLIDDASPEFQLPGLDGGEVASSDFAGRIYIVNFWASWCVPCRAEAPHLQQFWERHGPEGVTLVGIVYQDDESKARDFRDEFGLTFPQAMDPDGTTALDFGVFGIPETFVIDERGVVMAKLIGAVNTESLEQVLAEVRAGENYTSRNDDYRTSPSDDG